MPKKWPLRWYHVLVETPDGERSLIAIEATSARDARQAIAADWGAANVREVTRSRAE